MNLKIFADTNLFNAGTSFFKQLNIRLNSSSTSSLPLKSILKDKFKSQDIFDKVSAACFLGLVDKSVFDDNLSLFDDGNVTFDQAVEKIHADYEGMMIFAVRIDGIDSPTRTQLADLTRAFNRASKSLPVVVLFKYGNLITLATSERITYKQPWREGEKIGKISLLKDIDILSTHAGHIKILKDLAKPGVRDFNGLYQQWRDVFNVQLLNRNFYKELSAWYFWALRQVEFPDDAEKNREIRNSTSVIRLITRLIFVWFLKEKRLVPEILFNKKTLDEYLKYDDINNSTYYKAILQNLFFATLNTKMKKDDPESRKFVNRQYGVQVFYRYERYFKDKKKALKLFEAIPFLNGGLFENLDKNIGKDNEIRIDCFSNRPVHEKKLKVPDCLFLGDEVVIDLSKEFGSKKRKKEKVRGIIHILNSYKFTIDENTPIEEEIALDPELLGKVFENLLASYNPETQTTARKQTGSFYTPREIVNYMVDESLKASLSNLVSKKIDNATEDDIKTGLDILFEYTEKEHAFTDNEVFKIVEAISELKILDPACGSGAFPMGILHKLVFILNKIDEDNKRWRELQKQRAVKETESAYNLGNKEERHQRLKEIEEAFDFNTSDYGRKLFLIENSIYGVDIQPIAVQIAKLRFFISLIVDQKTDEDKKNLGILPLPNLETKFVAANTLIGIDKKGQLELNFQNPEIDKKEKELTKVRERHFLARTPKTKEKYREKDKDLRNEIAVLLEKDGFASDVTKKLAHWNPYDQNTSADFFDSEWMFGLKSGFDIVIGNPPYIRIQTLRQSQPENVKYFKDNYVSAKQGNYDIYVVFVENSLSLLNSKGQLAFILPHKFFNAQYGKKLRGIISKGKSLSHVVHFGHHQVFPGSTNYVCLLFLDKQGCEEFRFVKVANYEQWLKSYIGIGGILNANKVSSLEWNFVVGQGAAMFEKLCEIPLKLGDVADIFVGLQTSADDVFILDFINNGSNTITLRSKALDMELTLERQLFRPLISGTDVEAYGVLPDRQYILFPYAVDDEKAELLEFDFISQHYPKTANYLLKNKKRLEARERGKFKGKEWYKFGRSQNLGIQQRAKICVPRLVDCLHCAYDVHGDRFLDNVDVCGVNLNPYYQKHGLPYVLGLLNSKVLGWFFPFVSAPFRGGWFSANRQFLSQLPFRSIDFSNSKDKFLYEGLIHLVNKIIDAKSINPDTNIATFEAEIDARVAHLYNLTEEEYSLILKETNCPDPFRVSALNVYRDIARGKIK